VIMLIYLDHALTTLRRQREAAGQPLTVSDIYAAVMEARWSGYALK